MENIRIARALLKLAKYLEAEYEYKSDPEHKHKPKGGGWKQTEQGWSRNDSSIQKMDSSSSNSGSTSNSEVNSEHYGDTNAPIRKFIKEAGNDPAFEISESDQKTRGDLSKNCHTILKKIYHQIDIYNVLGNKRVKDNEKAQRLKDEKRWELGKEEYEKWLKEKAPKPLSLDRLRKLHPKIVQSIEQRKKITREKYYIPNLKMFSLPEERRGKFNMTLPKGKDKEAYASIEQGVTILESIIDKDMIPTQKLSFRTRTTKYGKRDCYRDYNNTISLYNDGRHDISAIAHEMGHYIEHNSPGVHEACKAFLDARTAGEEAKRLNEVTGGGYDDDEYCRKDHFLNPYCGKIYSWESTEILSKGMEFLATDPIGFYKQDREYYNFVRCILSGKIKNYKKENDK